MSLKERISKIVINIIGFTPFVLADFFNFLIFLLMRYVFKYRYNLIISNLRRSFPEKTENEINKITRRFYFHFSDLMFETIRVRGFSKKQYIEHIEYTNTEILKPFFEQRQNLVMLGGHFANWEWASSLPFYTDYMVLAVYKPLKNKFWNEIMKETREKFGSKTVPMKETFRRLKELENEQKPYIVGLVSDQCPPRDKAIWSTFLGQDTAYYPGPEKIAKEKNAPIIYLSIRKVKRHHYKATFKIITLIPSQLPDGEIIRLFSKTLEEDVQAQPELYVWSHKRWKYAKNAQ
jgi:KDO2-lipid IV(A) lauroyltransferase